MGILMQTNRKICFVSSKNVCHVTNISQSVLIKNDPEIKKSSIFFSIFKLFVFVLVSPSLVIILFKL